MTDQSVSIETAMAGERKRGSGNGGARRDGRSAQPRAGRTRSAASRAASGKPKTREARSAARREAILSAALDEFSARGFEATRLDDVARAAGIAKGTIYLYFRDKEDLFQELVRAMLTPLVGSIEAMGKADLPLSAMAGISSTCSCVRFTRRAARTSCA
jgi:AcrR family transcriptional regulator